MKFDPAYHLRTNKQVERALFVELLRRIAPCLGIAPERYSYVGMGGPYFEDFAMIQAAMGCKRMTSLEILPHVIKRQKFNQPHCRIDIVKQETERWVEEFQPTRGNPLIVWLDYSKDDWRGQIKECTDILPRLPAMSILKVTLTCNPYTLGRTAKSVDDRAAKLRELFPGLGEFSAEHVRLDSLHKSLKDIFAKSITPVLSDTPAMAFRPLAFYHYSDTTPILTITGIVGPTRRIDRMIVNSRLSRWSFACLDWSNDPLEVSVPDLGIRERLAIDRMLPDASAKKIVRELRLVLAKTPKESVEIVEAYKRFAKHAPLFVKAAI